jgi:hypothetical protein
VGRTKGAKNRPKEGLVSKEAVQGMNEYKDIDGEVLDAMSKTNRMRLTHSAEESLTLRQKQAAGAEYLASLVGHPEYRRRLLEASLKDPMAVLKIASSERPKEIHLEADIQHSVVVVPAQLTAKEWDANVLTIEGETVKEGW